MNMLKFFLPVVLALSISLHSFAWGKKGHDVTAAIAEAHLSPEARQLTDSLLDGMSLVYWANWLDNASYTPELRYTKTWHYKNVNRGVPYHEMSPNPAGDAVLAIKSQIEKLTDPAASKDDKALALKILIHVVGDMHQPMHLGHATDLGGNRIKLKFFDRETNLHSIWDDSLPEAVHKWSYSEWVDQIDRLRPGQQEDIIFPRDYPGKGVFTPGLIDYWAIETVEQAEKVYDKMPPKSRVAYDEIAWAAPVIETQLLKGGHRLAYILNYIAQKTSEE